MVIAQDLLQRKYISVDVNDTISILLGKLRRARTHAAVVFRNGKYLGVITKRFLINSRMEPKKMKVGNIVKHRSKSKSAFYVPTLQESTPLVKICRYMATSDSHILPVIKNNKVLGVVHAMDVLKHIAPEYRGLRADELATMNPVTINENTDLGTAITRFSRKGISHLPVVDDNGKLVGMLGLSDLIENNLFWGVRRQHISRAAGHQGNKRSGYDSGEKRRMTSLPVKNCLSRKNICCTSAGTKIPEAILQMTKADVPTIILTKFNEPVGILTVKDLFTDYAR